MSSSDTATTVSAPGKILLAGGYLVLESPNEGLVIAADKRFYCTVRKINNAATTTSSSNSDATNTERRLRIRVQSPQFYASWVYWLVVDDDTSIKLSPDIQNASQNGFVEKTLRVTLSFLWASCTATSSSSVTADASNGASVLESSAPSMLSLFHWDDTLDITIRADNDFYSILPHLQERQWSKTYQHARQLPKFLPCPTDPDTGTVVVHKTGLGSSAALVPSLVGALLQQFHTTTTTTTTSSFAEWNDWTYRLAQLCHCHAQGKVGSGFDVAAAVHGSHVYRRFPKSLLTDLLSQLDDKDEDAVVSMETARAIVRMVQQDHDDGWRTNNGGGGVVTPLRLPQGLQLLLADVGGGSESPSMARRVLQWKEQQQQQKENDANGHPPTCWTALAQINRTLVQLMSSVPPLDDNNAVLLETLSQRPLEECRLQVPELWQLRLAFQEARKNLKSMGEAVGVPIEPDAQTRLADATMELPGVVAALVPGAGGYDAMACLHVDSDVVREAIASLWADWEEVPVCPLAVQAGGFQEGIAVETNFELVITSP